MTETRKNNSEAKSISLNLTLEEVNKIMSALGNLTYIEVYQLINKIQIQAGQQMVPEVEKAYENSRQKNE